MNLKIGIDVEYTQDYKTMKPDFDIYFQIWITLQSFLIDGLPVAMATVLKIRHYGLYSYSIYPSMVNMQHFVFELRLLQFVANKRPCIVTMATRSK